MILGIGFLLIVSLVVSAAVAALGKFSAGFLGAWAAVAEAAQLRAHLRLRHRDVRDDLQAHAARAHRLADVWLGAAVTALLFAIGKSLIGLYLGRSSFASGFGAAGSLVVLLLWMYYSAQIFLLGAEFTRAYAHSHGSLRAPPSGEAPPVRGLHGQSHAIERSRRALAEALRKTDGRGRDA